MTAEPMYEPPRCRHGRILLGCPDDNCPEQNEYLRDQNERIARFERAQADRARAAVREALGMPPETNHDESCPFDPDHPEPTCQCELIETVKREERERIARMFDKEALRLGVKAKKMEVTGLGALVAHERDLATRNARWVRSLP